MSSEYQPYIWNYLMSDIQNEYGVAALMGNLQAESGLIPYRKQGDFSSGYTKSIAYTNSINNGTYTKDQFVHDSIGYGLAQWTFSTRKEKYYDFYKAGHYSSIGLASVACAYLLQELKTDFPSVYNALVSATSIRSASDVVLVDFESPADQSESVKIHRASLGQTIYDEQHGQPVPPGPEPPGPEPPQPTLNIPLWLLFKIAK